MLNYVQVTQVSQLARSSNKPVSNSASLRVFQLIASNDSADPS